MKPKDNAVDKTYLPPCYDNPEAHKDLPHQQSFVEHEVIFMLKMLDFMLKNDGFLSLRSDGVCIKVDQARRL